MHMQEILVLLKRFPAFPLWLFEYWALDNKVSLSSYSKKISICKLVSGQLSLLIVIIALRFMLPVVILVIILGLATYGAYVGWRELNK